VTKYRPENSLCGLSHIGVYSCCCVVEPSSQLVLIGLHAKPDDAVEEMQALVNVHAAVEEHWNTDNILIVGNLNAECRYASQSELDSLTLRTNSRFSWLIGDEVDTTTKSTDCAYDRCACDIITHL